MTLFLKKFTTKYNTAPFGKINLSDYKEAFEKTIELARTEIDSIVKTLKRLLFQTQLKL
jgi:Zn-dependent oligopeptidase